MLSPAGPALGQRLRRGFVDPQDLICPGLPDGPVVVGGGPLEPGAGVFGLVMLEALTGRLEYPGTVIESITARLHRRPVVPPELPWNLTALLETMTDPDPAWRPTAAAVAAALATASAPRIPAAAIPAAAPPTDAPPTEPPAASPTAA